MSEEMKIQVTHVTNYKLRTANSWADIVIDTPRPGAVQVLINSDYGSWSYFWGACGRDWKLFLSSLDRHYMASKFGCDREFDADRTLRNYRNAILTARRSDELDEERARECWDKIHGILEEAMDSRHFQSMVYDEQCFNWMYDTGPDYDTRINPQFDAFFDTFWTKFLGHISSSKPNADQSDGPF